VSLQGSPTLVSEVHAVSTLVSCKWGLESPFSRYDRVQLVRLRPECSYEEPRESYSRQSFRLISESEDLMAMIISLRFRHFVAKYPGVIARRFTQLGLWCLILQQPRAGNKVLILFFPQYYLHLDLLLWSRPAAINAGKLYIDDQLVRIQTFYRHLALSTSFLVASCCSSVCRIEIGADYEECKWMSDQTSSQAGYYCQVLSQGWWYEGLSHGKQNLAWREHRLGSFPTERNSWMCIEPRISLDMSCHGLTIW